MKSSDRLYALGRGPFLQLSSTCKNRPTVASAPTAAEPRMQWTQRTEWTKWTPWTASLPADGWRAYLARKQPSPTIDQGGRFSFGLWERVVGEIGGKVPGAPAGSMRR